MKFFSVQEPRYLFLFGAAEGKETQQWLLFCAQKKKKRK